MEGEQLEDQRNGEESSCNFRDEMDQRVHSLMFVMMMMKFMRQLLKNILLQNIFAVFDVEYTHTKYNTKFGLNCTHCFLFLVTCKQDLLPVFQVIMARPKHKMF